MRVGNLKTKVQILAVGVVKGGEKEKGKGRIGASRVKVKSKSEKNCKKKKKRNESRKKKKKNSEKKERKKEGEKNRGGRGALRDEKVVAGRKRLLELLELEIKCTKKMNSEDDQPTKVLPFYIKKNASSKQTSIENLIKRIRKRFVSIKYLIS